MVGLSIVLVVIVTYLSKSRSNPDSYISTIHSTMSHKQNNADENRKGTAVTGQGATMRKYK